MKKLLPLAILAVLAGCLIWDQADLRQGMQLANPTIEDTRANTHYGPAF